MSLSPPVPLPLCSQLVNLRAVGSESPPGASFYRENDFLVSLPPISKGKRRFFQHITTWLSLFWVLQCPPQRGRTPLSGSYAVGSLGCAGGGYLYYLQAQNWNMISVRSKFQVGNSLRMDGTPGLASESVDAAPVIRRLSVQIPKSAEWFCHWSPEWGPQPSVALETDWPSITYIALEKVSIH